MRQYLDLVQRVLDEGELRHDRTGVGTKSIFGGRVEFNLRERFPLVTAKETRWRVAFLEMLWFLTGQTNVEWLHQRDSKLWDPWADYAGNLGPVYGFQWRRWGAWDTHDEKPSDVIPGIDQIHKLITGIKVNPYGRRHIVTAWNVADIESMALPPCHLLFQCYATNDGQLDMQVYQRSWDLALGAPFNIAQYALLLHLIARATDRYARRLSFVFGDAHLYLNHIEAMREVVAQGPEHEDWAQLFIDTGNTDIDGYKIEDFRIEGYLPRPFISLPVAV